MANVIEPIEVGDINANTADDGPQTQQRQELNQLLRNQTPARQSTQIRRILSRINKAWAIDDINASLAPANRPANWTERPAKELSKLANATQEEHRDWAIDLLQKRAGEKPLSKRVIESVYETACREGKVAADINSGGRGRASRARASTADTSPLHSQQTHSDSHHTRVGQQENEREFQAGSQSENASQSKQVLTEQGITTPANDQRAQPLTIASLIHQQTPTRETRSTLPSFFLARPPPSTSLSILRNPPQPPVMMSAADRGTSTPNAASVGLENETSSPIQSRTPSDTNSLRRISHKRSYTTLILQSRDALRDDITRCKNDLRIHLANKTALAHEVDTYNPQTQLDLIQEIKDDIKQSQSSLAEFQKILASFDTAISEASPQGQQLLVRCAHQSTSTHDDNDTFMTDLSSNYGTGSDAPLPEKCVACLWARFMPASAAQVQAQEKSIEELKSRQEQAEKDHVSRTAKVEEDKQHIAVLDKDIELLEEEARELEQQLEENLRLRID